MNNIPDPSGVSNADLLRELQVNNEILAQLRADLDQLEQFIEQLEARA